MFFGVFGLPKTSVIICLYHSRGANLGKFALLAR